MKNMNIRPGLLSLCAAVLAAPLAARAGGDDAVVALSTLASADYVRPQLPNGTYQPETFAFGKGGVWGGAMRDDTIDKLDFMDIARTIAEPLAAQGYVSSKDPKTTKLLIMVYWGTTHAPDHATNSIATQNMQVASAAALAANHSQIIQYKPSDSYGPTQSVNASPTSYAVQTPAQVDLDNAMTGAMAAVAAEDRARDQLDGQNASLLGYDSEWDKAAAYKGTPLEFRRNELVNEIEEGRYFVVLMAYDFQMMWKDKKPKMLWEARYSIRARGNDFSKALAAMTKDAARYFGKNSGGLIREKLPEGHVDIGQEKVIAYGSQN